MTNEAFIEALKPYLDGVLERENSSLNEVSVALLKKDGEYKVEVSAWAVCHRFKADTIEEFVAQVKAYDRDKQRRLYALERINQLKTELEGLEKEAV